jgi:hypothetical protein
MDFEKKMTILLLSLLFSAIIISLLIAYLKREQKENIKNIFKEKEEKEEKEEVVYFDIHINEIINGNIFQKTESPGLGTQFQKIKK